MHEIKSRYDLPIEVDGATFNITVTNASKTQGQELKEVVDKHSDLYKNKDTLNADLNEAEEEFEINKHILAHGSVLEKVGVMFEQKALNKKIFKLKKEIEKISENLMGVNEALEIIYKKRFDLMVSGEDKTSLAKELENKSIPFKTLFDSISELIKAAAEKK